MTQKTKRAFWLIGTMLIVATFLWLDHDPTASIGSRESVELRRSELESQISAVFDEEEQLVKSSVNLNEKFPDNVPEPPIFSIELPTTTGNAPQKLDSKLNGVYSQNPVLQSHQDIRLHSGDTSKLNQPAGRSLNIDP